MTEGEIDESLKDKTLSDLWTFSDVLSAQMLKYDPIHRRYAGDARLRAASQHNYGQSKGYPKDDTQMRKKGRPS